MGCRVTVLEASAELGGLWAYDPDPEAHCVYDVSAVHVAPQILRHRTRTR